jgi:hypothetical protein
VGVVLTLSVLDFAMIKIDRLEKECARNEIRLSALRCRLSEELASPRIVVQYGESLERVLRERSSLVESN